MQTLKKGSRGDTVRLLQQILGIKIDGIFGKQTQAAVKSYQAEYDLTVDGIVGPKTWAALGYAEEETDCEIQCEDLKQYASPHGNMIYGPDSTTYKSGGCGVVSFAIVCRAYNLMPDGETATETIQRIGKYSYEHGYRIKGGGTACGLFKTNGCTYTSTTNAASIEKALRNGNLIIMNIKKGFGNGYSGTGHYVVAYGIRDDYVLLRDVGSSQSSRQKAKLSTITTGLKGAYIMRKE